MFRHLVILFSALAPATSLRKGRLSSGWTVGAVDATAMASGLEFRGTFRDFKLWKDAKVSVEANREASSAWVVEFDNAEDVAGVAWRAESLGLEVVLRQGESLMIQGEDVPEKLGLDSCGGNKNKTLVPVADHEVRYGTMASSDLSKYKELAKTRNGKNIALRDQVSQESLRGFIQKLQDFKSRNSYSGEGGTLDQAADWAAGQLNNFGWSVTRDDYRPAGVWWRKRITPQIVAEMTGTENPERVVVVGAHIDSIASRTDDAPGADDNGSGSSVLLELARIIGFGGVKFKNTIRLVLFTGEEQGLYGSAAIAKRWKQEKVDIICMLNADMMGYKRKGEPVTFALVARNSDRGLLDIVNTATETYMGGQLVIGTSDVCCSDQQSFYQNGFPAVAIFETPTRSVVYPHYHKTTDLLEAIDMEQMVLLGSGFMASAILFAELAE